MMNYFHHKIIHELWMDNSVDYIYSAGGKGPSVLSHAVGPTGMSTDVLLTKLKDKCNKWTLTALSYMLAQGVIEGFYKQIEKSFGPSVLSHAVGPSESTNEHWYFCYNDMIRVKRNNILYRSLNPMMCCPCYLHQYCLVHL